MRSYLYAVTEGEQENPRIVGIFSTENNARTFMEMIPSDNPTGYNDICKIEVDPEVIDILHFGNKLWWVLMSLNGTVISVSERRMTSGKIDDIKKINLMPDNQIGIYVFGRNQRHAIECAKRILRRYMSERHREGIYDFY